MSLKILSDNGLNRHHEQARQAIADAMHTGNTKALRAALSLAHRVELEKARRNSERGAAQ